MRNRHVFINCPFSDDYRNFFRALIFVIVRSGFSPRCARENDDGGEVRIEKIARIIAECRYGVHDISKTEPDRASGLPRFNMPLELGLFLGARKFGGRKHADKKCLILDSSQFRFQTFISDIAGQDIHSHEGRVDRLIEAVASWLRDQSNDRNVPGGRAIAGEFQRFSDELPEIVAAQRLDPDELTFRDLYNLIAEWVIAENSPDVASR